MPARASLALFVLLSACTGEAPTDKSGETGQTDDTGNPVDDTAPTYEEGCILVDDGGGYANITDAVAVATDGSVVSLCAGSWEESVVIDKALTLEGPGMDDATIVGPTNQPAIEIQADGVTIRGVAIESTRDGVLIDGASDARLVAVGLLAVDNYGVEANDALNLSVEKSTFNATGYGGILISGGTVSVTDSSFNDNTGFAIKAADGAVLSASDNVITGTVPTDPDNVADGHGIWMVESEGALSGNTLTDNFFVGIFADSSPLTLDGDSVSGSLYGVAHVLYALDASGLTLDDNYFYGLFAVSDAAVSVSGTTISGDPDAVVDVPTSSWGDEDTGYLGTGLYLAAPTITVSQTTVTGYNNAGLLVGPYDSDVGAVADLEDVTLTSNGRIGLYAAGADLTANDVNITGVVEVEDAGDDQCLSVGTNAAATLIQSDVVWTGGEVSYNDGYGLTSLYSVLDLSGATIAGNACGGVMNFGGALLAEGNTVTASLGDSFQAGIVSYEGTSADIVGNSFVDNQTWAKTYDYEYDDGSGNTYHYEQYSYEGSDIQLWYGGTNTITDNTFVSGTESVLAYDSDVDIEDNSWSDYQGTVFYTASSTGTTMKVKKATVDDFHYYGAYCGSANLDLSDVSFENGGSYYYEFYAYLNDEPYYNYSSEYANPVMYGYQCGLTTDDVTVQDTDGLVLRGYGGSYELSGLVADSVGAADYSSYDAIYFYGYLDTEAWLYDVDISNVITGGGVGVYVYDDVSTALHVDGLTLSEVSGTAMNFKRYTTALPGTEADLSDVLIDGAAAGLSVDGATLDMDAVEIDGVTGVGLSSSSATLYGTRLTINEAGSSGMSVSGGSLNLSDSDILSSGGSGLTLSSATADVQSNAINGNAGYGMTCSSVTFSACSNDLSGNALGTQSGCDEGCDAAIDY